MDLHRIQASLTERFHQDGHRIVVWNDPDAEFASVLGELDLDGVSVVWCRAVWAGIRPVPKMVEAAGIEPASASPPPSVLHA